jgi:hypothetical protein
MEARLTSRMLVQALLRRAEQIGGSGAVLMRGDEQSGAVTVVLMERGERRRLLERVLQPDGRYGWRDSRSEAARNDEEFRKFLDRRRKIDPDLWLIELDTASAERFADEMSAFG